MAEGPLNCAVFEFSGFPLLVPSEESKTPDFPICSSNFFPSCVHFWAKPDRAPTIQMLPSLSKLQSWRYCPRTCASPHELTKLPLGSNSITGGAAIISSFRSLAVNVDSPSWRCKMNKWSRASMHDPPRGPITHLAGILSQNGSTSYFGTAPSACTAGGHNIADAIANMMAVATMTQWLIFPFIFDLAFAFDPN